MSSASSNNSDLRTEAQAARWLLGLLDFERTPAVDRRAKKIMTLDRFRELLDQLGRPQDGFPSVHIAGTSGKGWIASALESIAREAGLKTGLYTSPHLRSFRERIQVDGKNISERAFCMGVSDLGPRFRDATGGGFRTVFEILTALAFQIFADRNVELGVIETGLGGRLDCTSVVHPKISVLTTIGLDHTATLGPTVDAIALDKAGIIKPGSPVVVAPQAPGQKRKVLRIFRDATDKAGVPLIRAEKRVSVQLIKETLDGSTYETVLDDRPLKIRWNGFGPAAESNLLTVLAAVSALRELGFDLPDRAAREGLKNWEWPGRLEVISKRPAAIVDGAHNELSAIALRAAVDRLLPDRPVHWVYTTMRDKRVEEVVKALCRDGDTLITATGVSTRAMTGEECAERAKAAWSRVEACNTLNAALKRGVELAGKNGVIVATGSLYIMSPARRMLKTLLAKMP